MSPGGPARKSSTGDPRSATRPSQHRASSHPITAETYLEDIEENIELDCLLPAHAVVHLARVGDAVQGEERPRKDDRLCEVTLVREAKMPPSGSGKEVVVGIGDEVGEGGEHAKWEDRKGVQERVEADDDAKQDDLDVM